MKIDLVNPSEHGILENAGDRVPIGLLSIGATLKQRGHDVNVVDLNHKNFTYYVKEFEERQPDAVGVSVYTSQVYREALDIAKWLRGRTRLIAGGYHATAMPETLTPYFDAVVTGEGEEGIEYALLHDGIYNPSPPNLSEIPRPARYMVDMNNYDMESEGERQGTIITSRGCPYDCSFCGKMDNHVRFEPARKVKAEIEDLREAGFKRLYFLDDCFTLNTERMKDITKDLDMPYRATTRANLLDRTKIDWLKGTGCDWLSMGFESGNDEVLERVNKHMTTDNYRRAVEWTTEKGIKTKGFFILGLPGETEQTARETIELAKELRGKGLTDADFYFLTPFPGTPIWNNPEKFGIEITDKDFTKYNQVGGCFVNTEELKAERIEELVKEAKKEWHEFHDDLNF